MDAAAVSLPAGYDDPVFLGSGGWAQVYRCRNRADGREVAVKLLNQRLDDPAVGDAAFRDECRAATTLSAHPGVIKLLAAGITSVGRPWLAMELAANGTLAQLIRTSPDGVLPTDRALDLTASLADTLAWVHGLKPAIIHGDLKPANVLLDADERPQLGDFGVARQLGARHSVTVTQFAQTHAAPEVLRDGRGSPESDVWSLTATLFEMLTGTPPFVMRPHEGPGSFIERVQRGMPGDTIPDALPEPVRTLLRAGLEVDRQRRLPSMTALAEAVRQVQEQLQFPVTRQIMPPTVRSTPTVPFVGYTEALAMTTNRPLRLDEVEPAPPRQRSRRTLGWLAAAATAIVLVAGFGVAIAVSDDGHRSPVAGGQVIVASVTPSVAVSSSVPTGAASPSIGPTPNAPASNPAAGSTSPNNPATSAGPKAVPPWCQRTAADGVLGTVHRYYAGGSTTWTFELGWPANTDYPTFRTPGGLYLRTNLHADRPTGSIRPPYAAMTYMQGLPPGDEVNWQEISSTTGDPYSFQTLNPTVDVTSALDALDMLRVVWWKQRNAPSC